MNKKLIQRSKSFFSLLFIVCSFYSLNPNEKIHNRLYVAVSTFLKSHPSVHFRFEPLNLIFEFKHKANKIRIPLDSPFYVHNNQQITINLPALYHNGEVYLPKKIVSSLVKKLNLSNKRMLVPASKIKKRKKTHNFRIRQKSHLHFIVIDPGHGGRDPGAQGYNNISEKDVTLLVGKKLARLLRKKFPKTKVILTRKSDRFVSLEKRGTIANRYYSGSRFGVFLSLHCNATFTPRSHGFEIYYLHRSSANENMRLLMIRNNLSFRASKNIKKFTSYLIDSQIQKESKTLAIEIHRSFVSELNGLVTSRGIRRADFSVMRSVNMPALLIEMGYITNTQEASVLKKNLFSVRMGRAIVAGIKSFLRRRPNI